MDGTLSLGEKLSDECLSSKSAFIKPRFVAKRAAYTGSKDYWSIHGQRGFWPAASNSG
jgi:hypothetical protein